ncbi:hypothetical protein D1007_31525 [Hordeum vulgare]|nr:hypothetical protein D1007_31525 [Hordeum vulgare]
MVGGTSSKKTSSQGAWLGSEIFEGRIEALCHCWMLPPTSQVLVRIPGPETAPTLEEGEIVVFDENFYKGFGLPTSPFFSDWLNFFGLQAHHLAPNAIMQLSAFVILCEGFQGIAPPSTSGEACFSSSSSPLRWRRSSWRSSPGRATATHNSARNSHVDGY